MIMARALDKELGPSPTSYARPIVFVVDDDISVRESVELLIRCEGWQPENIRVGARIPQSSTHSCS